MLYGYCPYNDKTIQLLLEKIKRQPLEFPSKPQKISKRTENLIRGMLTVDPRKRIEWNELLNYQKNEIFKNLTNFPMMDRPKTKPSPEPIDDEYKTLIYERNKVIFNWTMKDFFLFLKVIFRLFT